MKNRHDMLSLPLSRLHEEQGSVQEHMLEGHCREMQCKVLSCKATVAKVIDDEAGIYLLSNCMKLYITFLKGLAGEVWNGKRPSKTFVDVFDDHLSLEASNTSSQTSSDIKFDNCLTVGDTIKILRCHYTLEGKKVTLVCCDQSCIINESRKLVLNTHSREQASWVTNAVHSLNLNFKGLTWLLRLKEELLSILSPSASASAYYSDQTPGGESDILISLVNEAKRRNMVKENILRSPVEEFFQPVHECGLMQDFVPPCELTSLKNIFHEEAQNTTLTASDQDQQKGNSSCNLTQESSQFSDFWSYSISPEGKFPAVLVGKLGGGLGGVLQLIQTEVTVDLVIIGNAGMALSKFGTIVALFNYHIVKEKFHIIEENATDVHKLYIVVRSSDLIVLEEPKNELSRKKNSRRYSYKLKLLSKSALVVPHFKERSISLSQFLHNKFFVGMTTIMKVGYKGEVLETWQKFVKFSGENAGFYPLLEVGDECELRIPPLLNAEIVLKQSQTFQWMKSISEDQSTECLFLPPEILIMKVSSMKMKWGEVSVQQVQSQGHQSELITITGYVMCKKFVSPRYDSEIITLPHDICKDCHIGVPLSMQFRLLIGDEKDSDSNIWLYMTCTTNYFTKIYPLFVIPGARIIATDVRRIVAKSSKNVYLTSSNFTHIIPLSIPKLENPHTVHRLTVMEPMYLTLSNVPHHADTFIIFARVNRIMRAALKVVCNICNCDMEQYSYCCRDCFAESSASIEASVELEVDDGTDIAYILSEDVRHFAVLFCLSGKDYAKLCNFVLSQCLHLHYVDLELQCTEDDDLKYECSEDFEMMITQAKLAHSYKFICRKQISQPHLCIDMSLLRPTEDVKHLQ